WALHTLDHGNDDSGAYLFPSGVKDPTVTMFVVVALMVCVVIMTIQNLKGDVSDLLKLRLPEISTG
ncbi:TPA: hypothetical protein ACV777_005420, partial [Escherichia coli]